MIITLNFLTCTLLYCHDTDNVLSFNKTAVNLEEQQVLNHSYLRKSMIVGSICTTPLLAVSISHSRSMARKKQFIQLMENLMKKSIKNKEDNRSTLYNSISNNFLDSNQFKTTESNYMNESICLVDRISHKNSVENESTLFNLSELNDDRKINNQSINYGNRIDNSYPIMSDINFSNKSMNNNRITNNFHQTNYIINNNQNHNRFITQPTNENLKRLLGFYNQKNYIYKFILHTKSNNINQELQQTSYKNLEEWFKNIHNKKVGSTTKRRLFFLIDQSYESFTRYRIQSQNNLSYSDFLLQNPNFEIYEYEEDIQEYERDRQTNNLKVIQNSDVTTNKPVFTQNNNTNTIKDPVFTQNNNTNTIKDPVFTQNNNTNTIKDPVFTQNNNNIGHFSTPYKPKMGKSPKMIWPSYDDISQQYMSTPTKDPKTIRKSFCKATNIRTKRRYNNNEEDISIQSRDNCLVHARNSYVRHPEANSHFRPNYESYKYRNNDVDISMIDDDNGCDILKPMLDYFDKLTTKEDLTTTKNISTSTDRVVMNNYHMSHNMPKNIDEWEIQMSQQYNNNKIHNLYNGS